MKSILLLYGVIVCNFHLVGSSDPKFNGQLLPQYHSRTYGKEIGLTANSINDICQTEDGYLWLGTDIGLFKFDGTAFKQINDKQFFSKFANNITQLINIDSQHLWMIVDQKHVIEYNRSKEAFSLIMHTNVSSEKRGLTKIRLNQDGSIFVIGQSVWKFESRISKPQIWAGGSFMFDAIPHSDSSLIVTSHKELPYIKKYKPDADTFNMYKEVYLCRDFNHTTNSILIDSDDNYWAATWTPNLIRLKLDSEQCYEPFPIPIYPGLNLEDVELNTIVEDNNGLLWIGTKRSGLYCFDKDHKAYIDLSYLNISKNITINAIHCSYDDKIWLATAGQGLISLTPIQPFLKNTDFEYDIIPHCLTKVKNDLIVGGDSGLLFIDNKGKQSYRPLYYNNRSVNTYSIMEDNGLVLVGTNVGLLRYDILNDKLEPLNLKPPSHEEVVDISNLSNSRVVDIRKFHVPGPDNFNEDSEGNKYDIADSIFHSLNLLKDKNISKNSEIGFSKSINNEILLASCYGYGLVVIDEKNHLHENSRLYRDNFYTDQTNKINKIYIDNDNHLWFLTEFDGVWKSIHMYVKLVGPLFYPIKDRIFSYQPFVSIPFNKSTLEGSSYSSDNIIDMVQFNDEEYFLINKQGELLKINEISKGIVNIPIQSEEAFGLSIRNDVLFVMGASGIEVMDLSENESMVYGSFHGLKHSEVSYFIENERLYLLGKNGITVVSDLSELRFEQEPGKLSVSFINANGQNINFPTTSTSIDLEYTNRSVELGLALLDFEALPKTKIRYKLSNYNSDWVDHSLTDIITLENVGIGLHELNVQVLNSLGEWHDYNDVVSFNILPPFWKTVPFYVLSTAIISFIVFGFHRLTLNRTKRIAQLKLETEILAQEAERKRLAESLHDDFGIRISALRMYIETIENSMNEENESKKIASSATKIVDDSMKDFRNLLVNLSPHALTEYGLVSALKDLISRLNQVSRIKIKFTSNYYLIDNNKEIELSIFRIVQELINNSIKHSGCSEIHLHIDSTSDNFTIKYHDNGKGFDVRESSNGYGLKNIQRRVELHSGKIEWANSVAGVKVTITIPQA